MILVDTSIWVQHLRAGDPVLTQLLDDSRVLSHPWVVGELALGRLVRRAELLTLLASLPQAVVATDEEVLTLIGRHELYGLGIGYVDAQLLAATKLTPAAGLWTRDKRLQAAAAHLGHAVDLQPAGNRRSRRAAGLHSLVPSAKHDWHSAAWSDRPGR